MVTAPAPKRPGVRLAAILSALAAAAVSLLAVGPTLIAHDGNPSALVRIAESDPIAGYARLADEDFVLYREGHYDGAYFYAVARDPFARSTASTLIDRPAYRYGHPGYGWLAAIAGAGRTNWFPMSLLVLSLLGMTVAGGVAAVLAGELGASPWLGLSVAFNPGLLFAVTVDTSEAVGAALLIFSLWLWLRKRVAAAGTVLIVLVFTKEIFLTVPVMLALWEVLRRRRARGLRLRLGVLALPLILYGVWSAYLYGVFDVTSFAEGGDNLALPLAGWLEALRTAGDFQAAQDLLTQLGSAAAPLLAATLALLVGGLVVAIRRRRLVDWAYIGLAAVVLSASWMPILFPKDLMRTISLPLVLLPLVFSRGRDPSIETDL